MAKFKEQWEAEASNYCWYAPRDYSLGCGY